MTTFSVGVIGVEGLLFDGLIEALASINLDVFQFDTIESALSCSIIDAAVIGIIANGCRSESMEGLSKLIPDGFFIRQFLPGQTGELFRDVALALNRRLVSVSVASAGLRMELSDLRRMFDSAQRSQVTFEEYLHRHGLLAPTRLFATAAGSETVRIKAGEVPYVQPLPRDPYGLARITIRLATPIPNRAVLNIFLMFGQSRAHAWTVAGPVRAGTLELSLPQASLEEYRVPSIALSVAPDSEGDVHLALASQKIAPRWGLLLNDRVLSYPLALELDYAPPGTRPNGRVAAPTQGVGTSERTAPIVYDRWEDIRYEALSVKTDWQIALAEDAMLQAHPLRSRVTVLRLKDISPSEGTEIRVDIRLAHEAAPRTGFAIALVPSGLSGKIDASDTRLSWASKRSDWFELKGREDGRAFLAWEKHEAEGMTLALVTTCLDNIEDFAWARWGTLALQR